MRLGNVPVAKRRRFVLIKAQMNTQLDFRESVGKPKVCRRRKCGIAAQNQQSVNGTCLHVADEFAQRLESVEWRWLQPARCSSPSSQRCPAYDSSRGPERAPAEAVARRQ